MKGIYLILMFFMAATASGQTASEIEIQKELNKLRAEDAAANGAVSKLIGEANKELETASDSIEIKHIRKRIDDLWVILDGQFVKQLKRDLELAKLHPSSMLCLQQVQGRISRYEAMDFYDEYESIYHNLSPEIKSSAEGKKLEEQLKYFRQSMIGSAAPGFSVTDVDGAPLTLDDFKGKKYVLIDFWASWCAPCREEFPILKDLYKKYGGENFEIINISRDEKTGSWKKAIAKDNIGKWRHFSTHENNSTIEKEYFVIGIPHKVLIDKNGIIIGKWKGGGETNARALERKLAEIFGAQ
jgi:thiol-disulfide isomerase/thioredoxin